MELNFIFFLYLRVLIFEGSVNLIVVRVVRGLLFF